MKCMKKLTALPLIATFLTLQVHPAVFADDSDIFGANIQPNVMLLIDNSGSMYETVPGGAYDPAQNPPYPVVQHCDPTGKKTKTYSDCTSTKVYKSPLKDEYDFYKNTVSDVQDANAQTTASAQNALNTVGYWSGKINKSNVNLYTGSYLNYLIGVCGGDPTCQEPKMKVAQDVVNFLLDNVHGVRFGVMTFWYSCGSNCVPQPAPNNGDLYDTRPGKRGGRVVAEIGSDVAAMKTAVNALTPSRAPRAPCARARSR